MQVHLIKLKPEFKDKSHLFSLLNLETVSKTQWLDKCIINNLINCHSMLSWLINNN